MKTRRWGPVFVFVTVLAFVSAACKDSNAVVAPSEPVNLAGAWVGTFESFDWLDCNSGTVASATLTQEGTTIEGVLHMAREGCGAENVLFHGSLDGGQVHGTLESGGGFSHYNFSAGSIAEGTITQTTLELTLREKPPSSQIPGGTMLLHR